MNGLRVTTQVMHYIYIYVINLWFIYFYIVIKLFHK